jgi:hypothetical protein
MKTSFLLAGLVVSGLSVFLDGARAGPFGGGFRGGSAGRGFGAGFGRQGFGGGGSRAFVRPGFRFPNHGRFFVRHRRYPLVSILDLGAFGYPWGYPGDGYLYDSPAPDYQAASAGPQSDALPVAIQSEPIQSAYQPSPVYVVINTGNASPAAPAAAGPGATGGYAPTGSTAQQTDRFQGPDAPAPPGPERPAPVHAPSPGAPAGMFDRLALVSWFEQDGKDTALVEDTDAKDVREITSEPNKDNLRIVEIHPNVNPKLSEVIISDGTDQRAIRFRSESVHK